MRELTTAPGAIAWVAVLEPASTFPPIAVGVHRRRLAGFVLARALTADAKKIVYLETLEIVEGVRRQGAGAGLLHKIEDAAQELGVEALWLHVAEANAAAFALYRAHGFQVQGREENYYGPGAHGIVCVLRIPRCSSDGCHRGIQLAGEA